MKPGGIAIGWEIASWVIVLFLVWGSLRFLRSAREVHAKGYVDPSGRVFSDAERRRVVFIHALFGIVALLGAGFAAIGVIFF